VCVGNLRYPAYEARTPYYIVIVTCLGLPYFSTLSHKPRDFRKQLLNVKFVFGFSLQILSEIFLIRRRTERDIIINVNKSSLSCLSFLSDFNKNLIFDTDFRRIIKYQISRKSVQWEPNCSVRTDGQTDMTQLMVAFRNFANAPKRGNFDATLEDA
jgi:hypothetical protein